MGDGGGGKGGGPLNDAWLTAMIATFALMLAALVTSSAAGLAIEVRRQIKIRSQRTQQ